MNINVERILEITITAVVLYLVLTNGKAFADIITAAGSVYGSSVRALQGR